MTAIRRELGAIIDKLHRVDFNRVVETVPGMGGPSFYMKDLVEKLTFIKTEVLSKFNLGDTSRSWFVLFLCSRFCCLTVSVVKRSVRCEVRDQDICAARVYNQTTGGGREAPINK